MSVCLPAYRISAQNNWHNRKRKTMASIWKVEKEKISKTNPFM